jgi:hypothetical protein
MPFHLVLPVAFPNSASLRLAWVSTHVIFLKMFFKKKNEKKDNWSELKGLDEEFIANGYKIAEE